MDTTARAEADVPSETFKKYSFDPNDVVVGEGRLLQANFSPGSGLKRFVTPADQSLRAGFDRSAPGRVLDTFFWYKELWYVIDGTAVVTVTDKRTGEEVTERVKERDALYFPEGVRVHMQVDSDRDLLFFYCAVPASKRDAPWLAAMDERDVEDVRKRGEYRPRPS